MRKRGGEGRLGLLERGWGKMDGNLEENEKAGCSDGVVLCKRCLPVLGGGWESFSLSMLMLRIFSIIHP